MINQQLLDYIKQQLQQNNDKEKIKNSLMSNGWEVADVEEGFTAVESRPISIPTVSSMISNVQPSTNFINPAVNRQSFINQEKPKRSLKFLFIFFLIIALAGLGWFGFNYFNNSKINNQAEVPLINQETNQIPAQIPATSNPDIDRVTAIMADICQGYLTDNNSLIIKHASTETVGFLSSAKLDSASACTVNKIYQSSTNIIANVTVISTPSVKLSTKLSPVQDMVFIKEGDDWKFDMTASLKFAMDQSKAKAGNDDSNGFVDLVIISAIVSPSYPIVNSKDVQVVVTIKNIGTKTSDTGAPLVADLLGFKDEVSITGGNYGPLVAGGTVEWIWYPYKYNDSFKISDTPGQKTIKIELNPDRTIMESNYTNDVFTQTVQMYKN